MSTPTPSLSQRLVRPAQVIIVGSVMFTFISFWRTAAVVLCDLASTAYYIGGIVEQAIGPAAPWFILAVMLFSYAVRAVYIESCTLFVRGGVYRVVREAMGGFSAKLAVSALMFDYVLTGPISGVSAGQYLIGLILDIMQTLDPDFAVHGPLRGLIRQCGSVLIAIAITVYFFRQNVLGIHHSSDKAMKIMIATTIMAAVVIGWCLLTLAVKGPANPSVPLTPDLSERAGQDDPLGFLHYLLDTEQAAGLRHPASWLSLVGLFGILIAFGHSILAMSGEETLAQVYREVEAPKLKNFEKAAFIVFVFSLVVTGGISFLAVLLIPNDVRMSHYADNLIGGLAMSVWGPGWARVLLNAFVTLVGFLILAGAVNTAMIGSNGVLNRVAEDGVLTDWFLKPHERYGTTYRLLYLILGLQLFTIVISGGNVFLLGEAYAFGVLWSFVFQALSMTVLRFKDSRPREFRVPFNFRVGKVELPVGLGAVLLVLLLVAGVNFFTKELATICGLVFTGVFFSLFTWSERRNSGKARGPAHEHLEQFNEAAAKELSPKSLGLEKPYRRLVAIRSPRNRFLLEKTLAETDPESTDFVVVTAKVETQGGSAFATPHLDRYDQELLTALVQLSELAGKEVKPLVVQTNNPLYAVMKTAHDLKVHELVMGASNKHRSDEQLEQAALYWLSLKRSEPAPLTVRILGQGRDVSIDLAGGNRIPTFHERQARSVAELRAAGVGVQRVLMTHDGSPPNSDLFQAVLTLLDPKVELALFSVVPPGTDSQHDPALLLLDQQRAGKVGRKLPILHADHAETTADLLRLLREGKYDLLIVAEHPGQDVKQLLDMDALLRQSPCRVFVATPAVVSHEPESH